MRLSEVLPQLVEWFPPNAHVERELKGGGSWWFVPWQTIRARLNEVCPEDWTVQYEEPRFIDKWCHVGCTVVICGVSRHAIGSAEIEMVSRSGKDMSRGNPIERAIADSFKNACEQFGIAAYLDDQSDPKKREAFARYMQQRGHGKPISDLQKERIKEHRAQNGAGATANPMRKEETDAGMAVTEISPAQVQRLWAIARSAGYSDQGCKALIQAYGFGSSKEIKRDAYDAICERASSVEWAAKYNAEAAEWAQQNTVAAG